MWERDGLQISSGQTEHMVCHVNNVNIEGLSLKLYGQTIPKMQFQISGFQNLGKWQMKFELRLKKMTVKQQ